MFCSFPKLERTPYDDISIYFFPQERLLQSGDNKGREGNTGISWVVPILGDALRMVFQNLLLDCDENVLQCSQRVWRLLLQVGSILCLVLEVISNRVVVLYPTLSL